MAENRYYWLRLHEDFFSSKRIKKLRKIAGGDTYTIIYLKMQLMAIKRDGILEYTGLEDSFAKELALDLDEDPENVAVTVNYLLSCGLLEMSNDREFFVPYAVLNTGSEGSSAKRVRDYRERQKDQKSLHCNAPVTPALHERYGEKEIEKELEIEKETIKSGEAVKSVINYLNQRAGTAYKATSKKTRELVNARMNEGFTVEDFKTVIDNKVEEWGKPPKAGEKDMRIYIRPETLFGTKFEVYLNQRRVSNDGEHERIGRSIIM